MTPERHARIQEIFEAAVDLPVKARNAYVDQVCGSDADLRAYVVKLLEEDNTESIDTLPRQSVKECSDCKRCYDDAIAVCPADGKPLEPAMAGSLLVDRKYRIEQLIGRGGMGAVYLVNHVHLNKRFALKLISADGPIPVSHLRSFETEARALGQVKHPNIVGVTDYGIDPRGQGMPYLVMEYLEGRTVRQFLREHEGVLSFSKAIRVLRQVAEGIDTAHAQNIVHGDLKPANLFLTKEVGQGETTKILDFGLARLTPIPDGEKARDSSDANRTTGGCSVRGTPPYMAHELIRGGYASPASDRFALGALAYELLTGSLPFGQRFQTIKENQRNPPPVPSSCNPNLPPELDAPILALLNPAPDKRPASSVSAVAAMEDAWLSAEQRSWRKREVPRRFLFAAIGAALVILIAGLTAGLRVGQMLEDRTVDARFAILPPRPPDPKLFLVVLDEATLAQDPRPIADWDPDFARMINQVFSNGARAVALDLLLPGKWSLSREFGAAIMAHPDRVALAKFSTGSGGVIGTECISPLVAYSIGSKRFAAAFGFVNLDEDPDGRIRRTRVLYLDRDGQEQPSFAARAVLAASPDPDRITLTNQRIWIDHSTRSGDIPKLSWKDVAGRLQDSPGLFRDRLVIIGAEYDASNDIHYVPASTAPNLISGAGVQALIANTILNGFPIRDFGLPQSMLIITTVCFGTFALALRFPHRPALTFIVAAASFCGYALFAFAIFRESRIMLALIGPELAIILSAAASWVLKSRLQPYPLALKP